MVEIDSPMEQELVEALMSSDTSTGAYWLGLADMAEEGIWIWQKSFSQVGPN